MRVNRPWYYPHVEWPALLELFAWSIALYVTWLLFWSLSYAFRIFAVFAGLLCLLFFWDKLKTLWRNQHPFVFAVRGDRRVIFHGKGRDEILFEENGRKVVIYSELWSKPDRGIYAGSVNRWEPPYENEPLTDEQRDDILSLLYEHYDYHGISYKIVKPSTG